jgi:hypothetical protein
VKKSVGALLTLDGVFVVTLVVAAEADKHED